MVPTVGHVLVDVSGVDVPRVAQGNLGLNRPQRVGVQVRDVPGDLHGGIRTTRSRKITESQPLDRNAADDMRFRNLNGSVGRHVAVKDAVTARQHDVQERLGVT